MRTLTVILPLVLALLTPAYAQAAAVTSARTIVVSEPVAGNVYYAGSDITLAAPVAGDVFAAGATIITSAEVTGDALFTGGHIDVRKPVTGDVRLIGGELLIDAPVTGDVLALGGTVTASTTATDTHVVGGVVRVQGSGGDVTVYGADVYLSGSITGDVVVVASDKLTIAEGTTIEGTLRYDAPQQVAVPATAVISGGVTYTGSSAFLPTNEEAKRFAVAGASVLLITRVIAVAIAAGVVVGLFPVLAHMVVERTIRRTPRRFVLLALLGFAAIVAAPLLILFLLVSFVGIALAVLLAALYVLLLLLAYLYAGLISGAAISQALFKKETSSWRAAVLGTLVLYVVGLVPVLGFLVTCIITSAGLGALMAIVYRKSFTSAEEDTAFLESEEIPT